MSSYWQRAYDRAVDRSDDIIPVIDTERHRYPFSIVWTPIHPITWFLPFVGHMGICDSRGICLDFTGAIGVDDLAFGSPTRYLILNPKKAFRPIGGGTSSGLSTEVERNGRAVGDDHDDHSSVEGESDDSGTADLDESDHWDRAVIKASKMFEHRMHLMICGSDCHSHCAVALNLMEYGGCSCWNKVVLAAWVFFCGRHTSWRGFV
eukprot:CAMPEP_0171826480 /NCGR_PEP_ID=MMETSP0992-20121227/6102_1 /TAXON_ID=483369 /ORGANISM="non described non described, Strain CCMP2098" /LENGTH=205 /DNA_ID=CAMNT_0012441499 /DNA_START=40 /DNA_END=654 /DNA_ORIENTATION=+